MLVKYLCVRSGNFEWVRIECAPVLILVTVPSMLKLCSKRNGSLRGLWATRIPSPNGRVGKFSTILFKIDVFQDSVNKFSTRVIP